ncbi:DinB family protein [Brevibacillus daliensis]|uniref:DinB family protein n=1 Tax=Brevibacillus daliensis TaxID=2892995 RepID=UPI001E62B7C9|nr:DinB family protein [Brevibacillus daliensis]
MIMNTVSNLEALLQSVPRRFRKFDHDEIIQPRPEGKWSRLQILGHLCDSAINNLSRFIQLQCQIEPLVIIPYNQEIWVEAQQYIDAPSEDVIALWLSLNQSVVRVISNLSDTNLSRTCQLPDGSVVTLAWLIQDYYEHMEHHLRQVFSDDQFL